MEEVNLSRLKEAPGAAVGRVQSIDAGVAVLEGKAVNDAAIPQAVHA